MLGTINNTPRKMGNNESISPNPTFESSPLRRTATLRSNPPINKRINPILIEKSAKLSIFRS